MSIVAGLRIELRGWKGLGVVLVAALITIYLVVA
jgi:hypothetical protein